MDSSTSSRRSTSLTWSWMSLCSKERIYFSFAWFSSDKAWLEDASSPFSAVKSSTVKEKLGGDAAWSWKERLAELRMIY
jgi:hypothetical protein